MKANIELKDSYKSYTLDQDKVYSPEETVARVRAKLSEVGIDLLAETERIDTGRLDIPVFISRCGRAALSVMPTQKQMGKGATPAQAEASAVMEMVERYSFFYFRQNNSFIQATYDEVADRAMPFEHIAASVHHDPGDLDRARQAIENLVLDWTPGFNLTRGEECLIPFNWFYEINEFNGPAAGNTLEEALCQGLCEVVERHVSALICREKKNVPSIDPESLSSPVARELVEKFNKNGIRLYMKDFTLDMGLPTVAALAYDPVTFPQLSEIVYTAGTATHPEKAVIRALTEVAQLAGDFNTRANFVASGLPKYTDVSQAEYITGPGAIIAVDQMPDIGTDNIKTEIESIVAALADRGLEVYAINVTHPMIGIPAVYTMVPGAHFRERAVGASVPFFAAKILTESGNPFFALAGLEQLGDLYPNSYYLHFYKGQALLEQGHLAGAAEVLQQALNMNPPQEDLAGILTYLGLALKDMEHYERAIEVLRRSAEVDSERRDTFNLLGFCYFKTKEHEKAIEAFRKVLELDPGSGIDYANIGTNFRELGRPDEAIRYYRTALDLDPTLDWVRDNIKKLENA